MDEDKTAPKDQLQVGYDRVQNLPVLMVGGLTYVLRTEGAEQLAKALTYSAAMSRRHRSAELN